MTDLNTVDAMTNDYRALCGELLEWAERTSSHYYKQADVIVRARALLDQQEPEGPSDWDLKVLMDSVGGPEFDSGPRWMLPFARAVLARWGRPTPQPEPVAPTDEEIMELMPQQMRDDLATAARAAMIGFDSPKVVGACRIILNRHAVDHVRAALAKWGHQ